jgi:hypothetical protein
MRPFRWALVPLPFVLLAVLVAALAGLVATPQ